MFHKEGYKIILSTLLITATVVISVEYITENYWTIKMIQLIAIILFVLVLQFFRNPKRETALNEFHIISPVDGRVVVIEEVFEEDDNSNSEN